MNSQQSNRPDTRNPQIYSGEDMSFNIGQTSRFTAHGLFLYVASGKKRMSTVCYSYLHVHFHCKHTFQKVLLPYRLHNAIIHNQGRLFQNSYQ